MEVDLLARALDKTPKALWPKLKRFEERKDIGRALSPEEEQRVLRAAAVSRSPVMETFVRVLLLTAMRSGELLNMTWGQVDLVDKTLTVGKAKTEGGTGRKIPINDELYQVLTDHARWFTSRFGQTLPEHFLFRPDGRRQIPRSHAYRSRRAGTP